MQRIVLILLLLGALAGLGIGYHKWTYDKAYSAGFNTAATQYQTASQEALEARISEVKSGLEATIRRQRNELESAYALNEKLREQEKTKEVVYREIPKVVEKSDCKRIGIDAMQLFNTIFGEDPAKQKQGS